MNFADTLGGTARRWWGMNDKEDHKGKGFTCGKGGGGVGREAPSMASSRLEVEVEDEKENRGDRENATRYFMIDGCREEGWGGGAIACGLAAIETIPSVSL
eukprot:757412-Hanusia_phi.AAC.3